jgi:hypothetical protein
MDVDRDREQTALDARVEALTEGIIAAIEPVIAAQVRQHIGVAVAETLRERLSGLLGETMTSLHVQTQPQQEIRRAQTGFSGRATSGVIEYMKLHGMQGDVHGSAILDYLQKVRGVQNRESARKAVTRTRAMGFIERDEKGRWHPTAKLKEQP